jgi:4'-phosphopantetheinyl transferase
MNDGGSLLIRYWAVLPIKIFKLSRVMLTVAWRSELSCKGFAFPQIQIIQHGY